MYEQELARLFSKISEKNADDIVESNERNKAILGYLDELSEREKFAVDEIQFDNSHREEVLSKPPPIPCKGYWANTTNGEYFECGYDFGDDIICDDCIVNGGLHDPRVGISGDFE